MKFLMHEIYWKKFKKVSVDVLDRNQDGDSVSVWVAFIKSWSDWGTVPFQSLSNLGSIFIDAVGHSVANTRFVKVATVDDLKLVTIFEVTDFRRQHWRSQ